MQESKRNKRAIFPGLLTAGNMFCGFLSITFTIEQQFLTASWLIILAAVFDALDGAIARMTRSHSEFGLEFDSLADVISFGLAPSILIYYIHFHTIGTVGLIISFMPLLFGAFRLARFNLDQVSIEKENFVGLPVPMTATALASYLIFTNKFWGEIRFPVFFAPFVIFLAFLMISHIEYEALPKFTLKRDAKNTAKLVFFILASVVVIFYPQTTIFPFSLGFILYGFVRGIYQYLVHDEEDIVDITTYD